MRTIAQRIELKRKELGLSKTDIWKGAGLSSGVYSQWMNGQNLTGENLIKVSKILGVTPEWLQNGIDNKSNKKIGDSDERALSTITINQYNEVGASMGKGLILQEQPGQITSWQVTEEWANKNLPTHTGKSNLYIITGFGDSMKGMFNPGDPLVIDAGIKECTHDGVYFFRVDNEGFVKRLQRIPGKGIRVISKNPEYETWTITSDMDFQVLGKVLKVWESTVY